MKRYGGQPLGPQPHIVILGSCKVGNFIVSTPVLRGLRLRFPDSVIGFIGSTVTSDLERAHPSIDWRISWDDPSPGSSLELLHRLERLRLTHGPVALAVNLDGFNPFTCSLVPALEPLFLAGGGLAPNRRSFLDWGDLPQQRFLADDDWDSAHFLARYRDSFKTQYIAELFSQLAFVADHADLPRIDLPSTPPSFPVPELLIHCTTARSAKIWPAHCWLEVIRAAEYLHCRVGLVGSKSSVQQDSYNAGDLEDLLLNDSQSSLIDLRGKTSLRELAGACREANAVISVDAGPLHIAAAVGTPTLAIVGNDSEGVGASPIRLWLPRVANVSRTVSSYTCSLCSDNKFRNDHCLVQDHPCMNGVDPNMVIEWLKTQLSSRLT